jgi:hypothetical protein
MPRTADPVAALADRVEADPFFLAWHVARHRRQDDLSPGRRLALSAVGHAQQLGLDMTTYTALRLCRAPRAEAWAADLAAVAGHLGIPVALLEEVCRA